MQISSCFSSWQWRGLLVGAIFARIRKFQAHAWCQSVIVLLNAVSILLFMLPSFRSHVWPRIPRKLGNSYYAMATAHAALEQSLNARVVLLLAAGTTLMPEKLRLMRYKLWMRIVLMAWWVVILLE